MNRRGLIYTIVLSYLCLSSGGCFFFVGNPWGNAYPEGVNDSDIMGRWTFEQTNADKIYNGLVALDHRMQRSSDQREVRKAFDWFLVIVNKFEDWPPDRIIESDEPRHWTTQAWAQQIFGHVESNATNHPIDDELLQRLRPDEKHARWMQLWKATVADLEKYRIS